MDASLNASDLYHSNYKQPPTQVSEHLKTSSKLQTKSELEAVIQKDSVIQDSVHQEDSVHLIHDLSDDKSKFIAENFSGSFEMDKGNFKTINEITRVSTVHAAEISGKLELELAVYKTRFWTLGIFAYSAFMVIVVWGSFGPIRDSVEFAYEWGDSNIALLEAWGPMLSVMCIVPFSFLSQKYGLRKAMLLATSLITLATGLRCISTGDTAFTYLANLGAIINGMASCLTLSLPAMISSTWFPLNERASATAVGSLATQLGGAGMYLSPLFVTDPTNSTSVTRSDVKKNIRTLMFIHFGMAIAGFLCIIVYFPEKPLKPPSVSSSKERIQYFQSIKTIIRNPQVLLVVVTYIFAFSIPLSWISVMNFSLKCIGISQDEGMWIAISAALISSLMSLVTARLTDHLYGHLRVSIMTLLAGSSCCFLWFLLITEKVIIISSSVQVFIAVTLGISFEYSAIPLLIELAVELAYPCPENVVGGLLIFMLDSVDTVFILLLMIPSSCFRWVSFALLASSSLTIIPLYFVKESHKRSDLDL